MFLLCVLFVSPLSSNIPITFSPLGSPPSFIRCLSYSNTRSFSFHFAFCLPPALPLPPSSSTPLLLRISISVLSFCLDSRWGLHAERVALGKGQTYARSVPGMSLLQAADRALTSCHLTTDLLVADVSITQGRHYWACSVEPGSYLVKVNNQCISK